MRRAVKILAATAAVHKEWEKLEKFSAWNLTKFRSKKEVIDEARTKGAKAHFASLMDICHLKKAELEAKHQKYKGRVVLRGHIVDDHSASSAVFTEQGSSASQMTAAKVMDIISRLPGCAGQAAGCSICFHPDKMEDAPKLLKIHKSECPDICIRLPRHVNTILPNTEKWLRKSFMKTTATVKSCENEVNENYSITSKTGTTRTSTSRPPSRTPMTTLTSTIAWRTCTESAHTALLFHSCDCLTLHIHGSSPERFHISIHGHPHGALSLTRFSLSTSASSSCLSPSSSSTSSCSLSSTTRRTWQTCAAPLQKRVRTPWTSSSLPQVMSPTSWPAASSTTHQSPSPSGSLPRTRTWMTWHSARCSQRHTNDKSTAVYQEACQSVSRRL